MSSNFARATFQRMAARTEAPKARTATKAVQVRLEEAQIQAVRQAALERASQRGTARADVSEIIREAINEWIARHPRRPILPR